MSDDYFTVTAEPARSAHLALRYVYAASVTLASGDVASLVDPATGRVVDSQKNHGAASRVSIVEFRHDRGDLVVAVAGKNIDRQPAPV